MPRGIYFASATPPLRCRTNLPSRVYLTPATPPLRYGANLPFGVYLAPAASPLRHTLIAVVALPEEHKRRGDGADAMFQEMKRRIEEAVANEKPKALPLRPVRRQRRP